MGLTVTDIMGTIRDNASKDYIANVPEYTRDNIKEIGGIILNDDSLRNEFCKSLWEKVALTTVKAKLFTNPLAVLKNNVGRPFGGNIEDIYINPAFDIGQMKDATKLLATYNPDEKACYYRLNRRSTYAQSIPSERLSTAFNSETSFMSFYDGVLISLYSGDSGDEFSTMKHLIGAVIDKGAMKVIEADVKTSDNAKKLLKNIASMSLAFTFPNTIFSPYNSTIVKGEDGDYAKDSEGNYIETPCKTWCPIENQVLIINSQAITEINYEVLATTFNLSIAQIKAMTIVVDEIPSDKYNIEAVLCDRESILAIDHTLKMESKYLEGVMQYQLFFNHWEWLAFSMFPNAIAFGTSKTA